MKQDIITNLKNLFFALLVLAAIFIFAIYFGGRDFLQESGSIWTQEVKNSYKEISPEVFNAMLQLKKSNGFFLLGIQGKQNEKIAGTDAFIFYDQIMEKKDILPSDKNKMIVIYSEDGKAGKSAARKLVLIGFNNVFHLKGGMEVFKDRGFFTTQN